MRVAYIINQYPGVSHSFIRTEILELERQGVEVVRIAMRGWDTELVDPIDIEERKHTRYLLKGAALSILWSMARVLIYHPARFFRAARTALQLGKAGDRGFVFHLIYLAEACAILGQLRRNPADHVHAHFGTNAAEVALLTHILGGPPFSFTVHGPEEFDKPLQLKLREKIRHAAFVVAITSFCRSQLYRWSELADWPKIKIVHCGLSDAFLNAPERSPVRSTQLLCVGRLCEQKGQLLLIEAMALLAKRDVRPTLLFAGDGGMRPEIERAIANHGLGDTVRIGGLMTGEQIRTELSRSAAMVLPSFAEGLPVVIMEAMALGCPPISTLIAGIPELVRDGIDGILVPAGDVQALTDAIERFLALPEEVVETMREQGRARVRERHAIADQVTKLARLFRDSAAA